MTIETVAIRLKPIDTLLGDSLKELRGLSPVVFTADQGLLGATAEHRLVFPSPLQAGHHQSQSQHWAEESEQHGRLQPKNALGRVIFVVDSSKSMLWPLQREGSKETRSEYVRRRFLNLPSDYLGKDTRMSLISFGRTAEVLSRDKSGISAVQRAFRSGRVQPIGGTKYPPALQLSVDILKQDCATYGEGSRPVVVLLTDGEDKSGQEEANFLMQTLRRLNCGVFIAGIGEDYKMKRVVQLAGYGGFSAWGHAAMESGKAAGDAADYDLFTGVIPRICEGIINADEYLTFTASGDFSHLTSASLSFFAPPPGEFKVTAGYVKQGRGLLFHDRNKELSIDLKVRPFESSRDVLKIPVPIVDEDDAAPYFETIEASRILVTQWLLSMAYANGDQKLAERVKKSIKPENPLSKVTSRLKGPLGETDLHSRFSEETQCGTILPLEVRSSVNSVEKPCVKERSPGERTIASEADSQSAANLHSGNLNFLDIPLDAHSLPPAEKPNAAHYNKVPGGSAPGLVFHGQPGKASFVETLEGLLAPGAVIRIGRSPECEVQVNDQKVSRHHCSLQRLGGYFWIQDEGSLNGTFLNGANIGDGKSVRLREGDTVSVCGIRFTFTEST
jgi:Mg-chelatase subunit ChlD